MKIESGTYADLPKGTKFTIPNPKWDGDKPKTQFYIVLESQTEMCIEIMGSYKAKVVK
jgi:hypothetical protein